MSEEQIIIIAQTKLDKQKDCCNDTVNRSQLVPELPGTSIKALPFREEKKLRQYSQITVVITIYLGQATKGGLDIID